MPSCVHPIQAFADFLIARDAKADRLAIAAGIDSPDLTSSLAIGEHVAKIVDGIGIC